MRQKFALSPLLFLTLSLSAAPTPGAINILYVDGVQGNDQNDCRSRQTACKTIGQAIVLAAPGGAIFVGPATYTENLTIGFNLGIFGSGADKTIIDGQGLDTVIAVPSETTQVILEGLTIRNGAGQLAGGIANSGVVTIRDTTITQNVAFKDAGAAGGGIDNDGTLTLHRSIVSQNKTFGSYSSWGGGIFNVGTMTIDDSTVSGNSSRATDMYGAGICNVGTLVVNRSTISGNDTGDGALTEGGGIYNSGSEGRGLPRCR